MKRMGKLLGLGILGLVLIILILFFVYLRQLKTSGLPVYQGKVSIPGLTAAVQVIRDNYGIPSILATNEIDLYLATGYVMAQDRLWQMDLLRRVTTGRLAEIFGDSFAETDLLLRALGFAEKARQVIAATPASVVACLEAFAAGVNAYLQEARHNLPLEFKLLRYEPEPWLPEHSAYLIGYMGWDLAFAWGIESVLWQLEAKLKGQEEKLKELLAEPLNPIFIYDGFSLPSFHGTSPLINHVPAGKELSFLPVKEKGLSPIPGDTSSERSADLSPLVWTREKEKIGSDSSKDSRGEARFFPASLLDAGRFLEERGLAIFAGSNNWAISGSLSSTGLPILSNDMHLALSLPGVWYPLHQVVEGGLHVVGVALPGEPFIVAGHNEQIAWGMTNAMADDMDFYLETVDAAHPDLYFFKGKWRPLKVREEVIKIKGGKEIYRKLRFTHRGPVVSEFKAIKDKVISMRWTGFEASNELLGVYFLNRARNWSEFREALAHFRSLCLNVIYADVQGNIGLQLVGGVPRRKAPGWKLLPGETAEFDWVGLVPFAELPFMFNPPSGYVFSANNKSISQNYPYPISYFFLSQERAERIKEFLSSKQKFTAADMTLLQADVRSSLVRRLKPYLDQILVKVNELSGLEKEARQRLREWNGEVTAESVGATIFEVFYYEFGRQMFADELGDELCQQYISAASRVFLPYFFEQALATGISAWSDDLLTPQLKETLEDIVARSFRQTITFLRRACGSNLEEWPWGKIHQLKLQHPLGRIKLLATLFGLNRGPYPVGGSFHTVCPFGYSYGFPFKVNHGASQRHVYVVGDWNDSLTIVPAGVAGVPGSPHYADQLPLYLRPAYRPDIFAPELVAKKGKYLLLLVPR
ncbi:MAG: penicillin acylase family protein [Candidatus Aminicenantales bacterium]